MSQDVGEYIVGAYLQLTLGCDLVNYNMRPPGGGMAGLGELDVIGFDLRNHTAYLCEVATHTQGLNYGSYETTLRKVKEKYERQRAYAEANLSSFPIRHYQFWSPVVPRGTLTQALHQIEGLEVYTNERYAACVDELRALARQLTHDAGNPFFRTLQILECLRRS